ncbi:MAG: AsmA-like C-terminal region-containing protein [Pseudomonadota bacterium]
MRRRAPIRGGLAQRCLRLTLSICMAAIAGTLLLVLLVTFRLTLGPVELPFLARLAETQLADRLGPARLTVGGAVFVLGDGADGPSGIRLTDVQLHDEDGRLLISAPQIGARFRMADALFGRIAPTELYLLGAHGTIIRNADGRFDLALQRRDLPRDLTGDASVPQRQDEAAFAGFLQGFAQGDLPLLQDLTSILMRDISLVYEDRITGRRWDAQGATVVVTRVGETLAGALRVRLEGDAPSMDTASMDAPRTDAPDSADKTNRRTPSQETPIQETPSQETPSQETTWALSHPAAMPLRDKATELSLDIRYRPQIDGLSIAAHFVNLQPTDLAEQIPALSWLRPLVAPLNGRLSLDLLPDGRARALTAALRADEGRLVFGRGPGVTLRSARLDLSVDALSNRLVLSRLDLDTAAGRIAAAGDADILREGDTVSGLEARIDVETLTLDMPGFLEAPIHFSGGSAHMTMALAPMRLDLHKVALQRGPADLALSGVLQAQPSGWTGALDLQGHRFVAADLVTFWPIGPAAGARLWAATRLSQGRIDRLRGRLDLGGAKPALDLAFDFSDGVATPIPGLPAIEGASGEGRLTLRSFTVSLASGLARLDRGTLDLAGSIFHIPDIRPRPATAQVSLRGAGPIEAALELIDRHPLSLLSRIGARPDLAEGETVVAAELSFPLLRKLKPAQVTAQVEAVLSSVTVGLASPVPIRAPRLVLTATQKQMQVTGPLALGPAIAQFDWTQVFKPPRGTPGGRMTARLDLSPAFLTALGLSMPQDALAGPLPASVAVSLAKGRTTFTLDADLEPATLRFPGWRKPAGTPGRLQLSGVLAGGLVGAMTLERIALDAPELTLEGRAVIGAGGKLQAADFDTVKLGAAIDSSLRWRPDGMRLEGGTLDLNALGRYLQVNLDAQPRAPDSAPPTLPLSVAIAVDRLVLTPRISLSPASGTLAPVAPGDPFLTLSGPADGGAEVALALTQADRGLTLRLSTDDAGRLLRDAAYFEGGHGGRLVLDLGMAPGSDTMTGRLVIRDIMVRDAPVLGEILSIASITGVFEQLTTGGLRFDRVEAHFSRADGVLYLTEGRATGGSLGITIAGAFDEAADALSFHGVFSPAYLFNGLLGEVPVLGTLLTGPRGEGVFGFSYEVEGSPKEPSVSVNPLSILTPGALRSMLTKEAPTPPSDLGPALPEMEEEVPDATPQRPATRRDKDHADR